MSMQLQTLFVAITAFYPVTHIGWKQIMSVVPRQNVVITSNRVATTLTYI